MADGGQSQSSGSSNEQRCVMDNEILQDVRELLSKDKSASLVKAVELMVLNVQQQREITILKETLQDAVQQKEQMGKEVFEPPVIESLMDKIVVQNNSTRKHLQEKLDMIDMHIGSNEILRKQLKKEIGGLRSTIEELGRRTNEKEDEAQAIYRLLAETKTQVEYSTRQRSAVAAEMAKLREEHQVKLAEQRKMDVAYEEEVKKMHLELADKDKELARCKARLENMKQLKEEKLKNSSQLQTEMANLKQKSAELKQLYENEVREMEKLFLEEKNKFEEMFAEANEVHQRKANDIRQAVEGMTKNRAEHMRHVEELNSTVLKVARELERSSERNKELKNELAMLQADGQTVVVTSVDKAAVKEPVKTKANLLSYGRFGKKKEFKKEKSPVPQEQPSFANESEFSFHMDNEASTSMDSFRLGKK